MRLSQSSILARYCELCSEAVCGLARMGALGSNHEKALTFGVNSMLLTMEGLLRFQKP